MSGRSGRRGRLVHDVTPRQIGTKVGQETTWSSSFHCQAALGAGIIGRGRFDPCGPPLGAARHSADLSRFTPLFALLCNRLFMPVRRVLLDRGSTSPSYWKTTSVSSTLRSRVGSHCTNDQRILALGGTTAGWRIKKCLRKILEAGFTAPQPRYSLKSTAVCDQHAERRNKDVPSNPNSASRLKSRRTCRKPHAAIRFGGPHGMRHPDVGAGDARSQPVVLDLVTAGKRFPLQADVARGQRV